MKSMELNWVRRLDKSLVTPEVVFILDKTVGGQYWHPAPGQVELAGREYDRCFGVIAVSGLWPENIPTALAHEWRHHWQHCHGWRYDGIGWNNPANYWTAIGEYFGRSRSEMDALLFQQQMAPQDYAWEWMEQARRQKRS